jgi:hypothetical protein
VGCAGVVVVNGIAYAASVADHCCNIMVGKIVISPNEGGREWC